MLQASVAFSQTDVLTQHNDLARTGWDSTETILNHSNVKSSKFGKKFTLSVDDQVFAQPLVVSGVNIPSVGLRNVLYVCTVSNSIYAFDADSGTLYWQTNFTPTGCRVPNRTDIYPSLCGDTTYYDFFGNIGIVGTPVIDKSSGTMYFVTKIIDTTNYTIDNHTYNILNADDEYNYSNTGFFQYLHAIDITTGIDKLTPVSIAATYTGSGDGSSGNMISFDPRRQFNRAGLVLSAGIVYIAFAAHCDWNPCHGWLLGYNATTLQQQIVYNTTPNDGRGGIWMSGAAPAVDESGNIYFTTGNSNEGGTTSGASTSFPDLPSDPVNRGESVVKLTPNQPDNTANAVTISSYFTPYDYIYKNENDHDFSIQVLLPPNTNMAVTGCKDDSLYIMDRANLGGYDPVKNNVLQTVFLNAPFGMFDMHSSLAYFGGSDKQYIYQLSENTSLMAFPVGSTSLGTATINNSPSTWPTGQVGGFMSVSSKGSDTASAILWIAHSANGCDDAGGSCTGILQAFKANDITQELWNSNNKVSDNLGNFGKMSCPTIANGQVYEINSARQVNVYGLLSNPLPLILTSFTVTNINNNYAQIDWKVPAENILTYFDVEKSNNGTSFSELKRLATNTNSNVEQHYSAVDDNPLDGINYYRLKETDLDGNIFYSSVVKVRFEKAIEPRIFPNPANSYFVVMPGREQVRDVTVFDASGKLLYHLTNINGLSKITISTESFTPGVYIVKASTATQVFLQKLFKQ